MWWEQIGKHREKKNSPWNVTIAPYPTAQHPPSDRFKVGYVVLVWSYTGSSYFVFHTAGQHMATIRRFTVPIPRPPTNTTMARVITWIGWNKKCPLHVSPHVYPPHPFWWCPWVTASLSGGGAAGTFCWWSEWVIFTNAHPYWHRIFRQIFEQHLTPTTCRTTSAPIYGAYQNNNPHSLAFHLHHQQNDPLL